MTDKTNKKLTADEFLQVGVPVFAGEYRGHNDDTFEYVDSKNGGVKKQLFKRAYIIEVVTPSGSVISYSVESVKPELHAPCDFKRGSMVVVLVDTMVKKMGSVRIQSDDIRAIS